MSTAADRAFAEAHAQGLPELVDDPVVLRRAAHMLSKSPAVAPVEPLTSARELGSTGPRVGRDGTQPDPRQGSQHTVSPDPAA